MQGEGRSEALRGRRILVVEDEGLILLTITDLLESLGCELAAAEARADKALAAVGSTPIDAALLDVNLGSGETSYAVAEALAARGIPFIFLTGYGGGSLEPEHRGRPVLTKPVDDRILAEMLTRLLDRGEAPA
jgi:CheY-like chemotaxis protein